MTETWLRANGGPVWTHDCERCRFMGGLWSDTEGRWDVYACNPSIVLRHGDDGPEYHSFDRRIVEPHHASLGAKWRAAWALIQDRLNDPPNSPEKEMTPNDD